MGRFLCSMWSRWCGFGRVKRGLTRCKLTPGTGTRFLHAAHTPGTGGKRQSLASQPHIEFPADQPQPRNHGRTRPQRKIMRQLEFTHDEKHPAAEKRADGVGFAVP